MATSQDNSSHDNSSHDNSSQDNSSHDDSSHGNSAHENSAHDNSAPDSPVAEHLAPTDSPRDAVYREVRERLDALLSEPCDWTAAMATVACELHHAFDYYHWTGFYRTVRPNHLQVGPYQGGHGCLDISFDRGVCGAAAKQKRTQLVPDVEAFPGHIACSSSTRSEIVVPILTPGGDVIAVLDVDSNDLDAFDASDKHHLEALAHLLGERWGEEALQAISQ